MVILCIAAHRAVGRDIGDDQPDRAVAFGLQREDAVIFERARQHHGERDRFAQHHRDRFGIGVLGEDVVESGSEPHQPSPQREGIDAERLDEVVGAVGTNKVGQQSSSSVCRR